MVKMGSMTFVDVAGSDELAPLTPVSIASVTAFIFYYFFSKFCVLLLHRFLRCWLCRRLRELSPAFKSLYALQSAVDVVSAGGSASGFVGTSALTTLLARCFTGNCRLTVLVHLSPLEVCFRRASVGDFLHVLQYRV